MEKAVFKFKNKRGFAFEVHGKYIAFVRPYKNQTVELLPMERSKVGNFRQACEVFNWHYTHGMQHRRRHPLGLNLYELTVEQDNENTKVGWNYNPAPSFDEFYAESKRYAERDGLQLNADGSLSPTATKTNPSEGVGG